MAVELQVMWDEAEALELEVERLWPDPVRMSEEIETGARELSRLKAEIRRLDGPARHRASLFVTSMAIATMAALGLTAWLMQGGF